MIYNCVAVLQNLACTQALGNPETDLAKARKHMQPDRVLDHTSTFSAKARRIAR